MPHRYVEFVFPRAPLFGFLMVLAFFVAPQSRAKMNVDFNPNLDFSKYQTFAYIGGVEHLVSCRLIPT